jgi:hypothetical protein
MKTWTREFPTIRSSRPLGQWGSSSTISNGPVSHFLHASGFVCGQFRWVCEPSSATLCSGWAVKVDQGFLNYQCKWTGGFWITSASGPGVFELPVQVDRGFLNYQCKWTGGFWITNASGLGLSELPVQVDQVLLNCHWNSSTGFVTSSGSEPNITAMPVKVNLVFLNYQWKWAVKESYTFSSDCYALLW